MNAELNYKKIREELSMQMEKSLFKRNPMLGFLAWGMFLFYWLIFYWGMNGVLPLFVAAIILGIIAEFLSMANHDILHGSVFKSRSVYLPLTVCISTLTLISPDFWRYWHDFHHKSVDRWTSSQRPYEMGYETNGYPALRKLIGPFELFFYKVLHLTKTQVKFIFDQRYKSKNNIQLKIRTTWQLIIIFGLKIFLFWMLPLKQWFFLELVALLVQNLISNVFLVTQHAVKLKKDDTVQTFSQKLPKWLNIYSLYLGHHVEHHLFPNLPSHHLPEVKKLMKQYYPEFECVEYDVMEALKKIY